MSYQPQTWAKGTVISKQALEHIENGIANISGLADGLGASITEGTGPIRGDFTALIQNMEPQPQEKATVPETIEAQASQSDRLITVNALLSTIGQAYGIAPLNEHKLVGAQYLPSYVDDILEYDIKDTTNLSEWESEHEYEVDDQVKVTNGTSIKGYICKTANNDAEFTVDNWNELTQFPTGETHIIMDDEHIPNAPEKGKIYLDLSTGRTYRWSGTAYAEVGVIHLDYDDDPSKVNLANWNKYYVKSVTQLDGQINLTHAEFAPALNPTAGTKDNTQTLNITVAGNSMNSPISLTRATADNQYGEQERSYGVLGVTRLSNVPDSAEDTLAATPKGVQNAINLLNRTDTAISSKYVSQVSEANGIISVDRADFSPSISWIAPDTTQNQDMPSLNITVAGNTGSTAATPNTASTAVYGVTKLSNTVGDVSTVAATPAAVNTALTEAKNYADNKVNALDVDNETSGNGNHITGFGTDQTLASLTETNGIINATFQQINITKAQISDLAEWAKANNKPTYNASEVGALPATTQIPSIEGLAEDTDPTFTITTTTGNITFVDSTDPTATVTFTLSELQALKALLNNGE